MSQRYYGTHRADPHRGNIISIFSTIFFCHIALLVYQGKSRLEIEYETIVYRDIKGFIKFPHQRTIGLY